MRKSIIFTISFVTLLILFLFSPVKSLACTYQSTITGNHLDFTITSDLDKLILVQYIRRSGNALVTDIAGADIGTAWTYQDDYVCNVYIDYPIGCRQIRNEVEYGVLGTGAFWQWSNFGYNPYRVLPGGIWSLDFDSPPTYESIGIEYGTSGGGDAWQFCTRIGNVGDPIPTPPPLCTYQGTITNNHLDFAITSNTDRLAVIQYVRRAGSALVTAMYGPSIGFPWGYTDDPNCDISPNSPIGCRQIRNEVQYGVLGTGAFWQWYDWNLGYYHALPSGNWSLDFDSPPTYDSLGIEYGTTDGTGNIWSFCTRTGDIISPSPSPTPSPNPTPSTIESIQTLIDTVVTMNLQSGIENSLDQKLQNALASLEAENSNNREDTINKLQAFVSSVYAQSGNKISVENANTLVEYALSIIGLIQ